MADTYTLVLDGGSSGPRCFLFDHRGEIVGAASGDWSLSTLEDSSPVAREFDVQALWDTFCDLIAAALGSSGVPASHVTAVSATSQRQAVVFLDRAGAEIYAGPNLDLRAVFEGASIDEAHADCVYGVTGHTPSLLFTPAKLLWFKNHRPDAYNRIASVLTLADWLAWRLTGEATCEVSLAAEAGLLDIHRRAWAPDLLAQIGAPLSLDVPLVKSGTIVGRVRPAASRETGLPAGTPVVASGADTQCGLLGMGVALSGQAGIVAGWSAPLQMVTAAPVLSAEHKTWASCFLTDDGWVLESNAGDAGNSYRWLADNLFTDGESAFAQMDSMAGAVPAGCEGAVAFLGPSRMNMKSLGITTGGFLIPVPLTFSDIGRAHLVRASLEGVAFAIKANLQQLEGVAGVEASYLALGGGMTRTRTFVKILVDVLGRQVQLSPIPQVSATGAYLCAAVALGVYGSLPEAASNAGQRLTILEPDPLESAEYQDHFARWTEISDKLRELTL